MSAARLRFPERSTKSHARMLRGMGASTGVKDTVTRTPATAERFWTISGVCRWPPPTPYALAAPITSEASRCGRGSRPAPDVPENATAVTSGSARSAPKAGAIARDTAVG